MGIERFMSTIKKGLNKTAEFIEEFDGGDNKIEFDYSYIYMDFNSIIYGISNKIYSIYSNKPDTILEFDKYVELVLFNLEIFFKNFLSKFNINNLKLLYIALDGVPTFSKIIEQKKRRYIGDFIEYLNPTTPFIKWNKNNISPGTIFMDKISDFLKKYTYSNIKIQISDTTEKGEAEMKILDVINKIENLNDDKILFFSPDSDVILLSMSSKYYNNISVVNYVMDKDKDKYTITNIKLLVLDIYEYCTMRITNKIDIIKLKNDIIIIFTMFGNDFLPKCTSITVNLDFLFLIDIYLITFIDYGYLLTENGLIDNKFLYYFFVLLSQHEKRLLFRNAFMNIYHNYNIQTQINFILDLYKYKDNKEHNLNGHIYGEPFYNFYNNILFYIDPLKLVDSIKDEKYHYLYFYLIDKYKLFDILYQTLQTSLPINSIVAIKLHNDYEYKKVKPIEYKSSSFNHAKLIKNLPPEKKKQYLIDKKLDNYYNIFNPHNNFYHKIIKIKSIDYEYYNNEYFKNTSENITKIYLKGLAWVNQYYFIRHNVDETWYYPYNYVPLFDTIVKYYQPLEIFLKDIPLDITQTEHLLYITPFHLSQINNLTTLIQPNEVDKVKKFIQKHTNYFFDLDNLYKSNSFNGLFDCSTTYFVNKCHYKLLEHVIDIKDFVMKMRIT